MSTATLIACNGARYVESDELQRVEPPPPTATFFPTKHSTVVETVIQSVTQAGFRVEEQKHSLSRGNGRYFGVLRLSAILVPGTRLAIGIRNATDRSQKMGYIAGNVVLACQNLSMRSDLMSAAVSRKHTKRGLEDFVRLITTATAGLEMFQKAEAARIEHFQRYELTDTQAESIMLRGYEKRIVSHRLLPELISAWRKPDLPDFEPRTMWSLENAFTGVLSHVQKANPARFCSASFALQGLLSEAAGVRPEETFQAAAA